MTARAPKPAKPPGPPPRAVFNILAVVQEGRLAAEAILLAASLRAMDPGFPGRLILAEPLPGGTWPGDPRLPAGPVRDLLAELGAEFMGFTPRHFGPDWPQGNKIEALSVLPDEPFLFLDTDTMVTGSFAGVGFDFARPSASMRREGTWPQPDLYGPGFTRIWRALYDRFGLDFASSLDLSQPDEYWQRYLYFNAGWFFHVSPRRFRQRFLETALAIRDNPPAELTGQALFPWLDQIALPLVIHGLGGGRPGPALAGLDGAVTCHWRALPLLYARESDHTLAVLEEVTAPNRIKRVLRDFPAFKRLVYQRKGHQIRAMFDRADLPRREQVIRNTIKRAGLWER